MPHRRLFQILIFQQEELGAGIGLLLLAGALVGLLAALLCLLPHWLRRVITTGLCSVAVVGLLQDLIAPIFSVWNPLENIIDLLFPGNGLSISGAVGLFIVVAAVSALWSFKGQAVQTRIKALPPQRRRGLNLAALLAGVLVLLVLPPVLGLFLSEVMTIVGLFILLGLGLNIVVGFAGLLDLGYVAFFAIGSYTVAILTSPELGFFDWNFWQALPLAVLFGVLAGVILGVPVLKMRGGLSRHRHAGVR